MTDSSDSRIKHLNDLHRITELTNDILEGAVMIADGGVSGLQVSAQQNPELVLSAIAAMASVIEMQRDAINRMSEQEFELYDRIERITSSVK